MLPNVEDFLLSAWVDEIYLSASSHDPSSIAAHAIAATELTNLVTTLNDGGFTDITQEKFEVQMKRVELMNQD